MTLDNLKTGQWVKTRNEETYMVIKNADTHRYGVQKVVFLSTSGFMISGSYNEDMTHQDFVEDDIVGVYGDGKVFGGTLNGALDIESLGLAWSRRAPTGNEEEIIMTINEALQLKIPPEEIGSYQMSDEEKAVYTFIHQKEEVRKFNPQLYYFLLGMADKYKPFAIDCL